MKSLFDKSLKLYSFIFIIIGYFLLNEKKLQTMYNENMSRTD